MSSTAKLSAKQKPAQQLLAPQFRSIGPAAVAAALICAGKKTVKAA